MKFNRLFVTCNVFLFPSFLFINSAIPVAFLFVISFLGLLIMNFMVTRLFFIIFSFLFSLYALVFVSLYGSSAFFLLAGGFPYLVFASIRRDALVAAFKSNYIDFLMLLMSLCVLTTLIAPVALFQTTNPDGNLLSFGIGSNFIHFDGLYRYSGWFIEPGYLGFYYVIICMVRRFLGRPVKFEIFNLFTACLTFSVVYYVCLALYFLLISFKHIYVAPLRVFLFVLFGGLLVLILSQSAGAIWAFDRIYSWVENPESSIRFSHLILTIELLSWNYNWLWGVSDCNAGSAACPVYVGNIFASLLVGGISAAILPIFFLFRAVINAVLDRNYTVLVYIFVFLVLMMAKPLFLLAPYSGICALFLVLISERQMKR